MRDLDCLHARRANPMKRDALAACMLMLGSFMVWIPWSRSSDAMRRWSIASRVPAASDPEAPSAAEELEVEAATEELIKSLDSEKSASQNGWPVKRRTEIRRPGKPTQIGMCGESDIACHRAEVKELLRVSAAAKSRNAMLSSRQTQQRKAAERWLCAPGNASTARPVPIVALERAAARLRKSSNGRCKPSEERLEALKSIAREQLLESQG